MFSLMIPRMMAVGFIHADLWELTNCERSMFPFSLQTRRAVRTFGGFDQILDGSGSLGST